MSATRLASIYLAIRAESAHGDVAALERELSCSFARARERHADIALEVETFVQFLASKTSLDAARSYTGDLYLACAAAMGIPQACERVELTCIGPASRAIARIDSSQAFVAEVQQRLRTTLLVGTT